MPGGRPPYKTSDAEITWIRNSPLPARVVARKFGISKSYVLKIRKGTKGASRGY